MHGYRTDSNGCPLTTCDCRDPCEGIRCEHPLYVCQLTEPECTDGVNNCVPTPKCEEGFLGFALFCAGMINPCPRGKPFALENGAVATCGQRGQCINNHWCHMVGYVGRGFCCPNPGLCRVYPLFSTATRFQSRRSVRACVLPASRVRTYRRVAPPTVIRTVNVRRRVNAVSTDAA